jgi:glutaredoxin-like protein
MIPLKEQDAIRQKFAIELIAPVKIDFFTEKESKLNVPGKTPCAYCKPTQNMLQELAGLSDLISLRIHYMDEAAEERAMFGVERVPATVLRGRKGHFVRYYGIPGGTEFPALLESIVDISRDEVLLSPDSGQALEKLERDVSVRVFVTPTCGYCPQMVQAVYQMALVSDRVHAEVYEVNEFPDLAEKYKVEAVPLTVINDTVSIPGALPEPQLVEQVIKAAETTEPPPGAVARPSAKETPRQPIKRGERRSSGLYIP